MSANVLSCASGVGVLNCDLLFSGLSRLPVEGEEIYAKGFDMQLGGGLPATLIHLARLGVPVDWRLELPRQLAIPEADFCMMLGNLLENALHASQKLPPEQRQVKVLARMLSPAMLGLLVENRYDGVLKRQQGILHSTKHDGMGIGLVSIQTAVSRYGGSMTVETENGLFRVNILLNL